TARRGRCAGAGAACRVWRRAANARAAPLLDWGSLMGTMICLAVGKLEVDWGKNNFFSDHGALFQASDLKPIQTYNEDEEDPESEPVARIEPGFGKPLRHVRDRLELMGCTVRAVEHHYVRLHRMHGMTDKPIPFVTLRRAL